MQACQRALKGLLASLVLEVVGFRGANLNKKAFLCISNHIIKKYSATRYSDTFNRRILQSKISLG